ncbi:MAG TPA: (2Fe-2S)-binding protein [Bryobacteraceae bacterium]|jgi:aerobic-type carbon monoxide dehydrogenase small subunit (CoxS/CutS family)
MGILKLTVNGAEHHIDAEHTTPLLIVLRDHLHLTGAKYGCGEGQCGACTVLLSGKQVRSCITPAGEVAGRPVETIEGLSQGATLHRIQQAFIEASAFQCGFCTPGMIMATAGLLRENAHPSGEEIRSALDGNICRCGTYSRIVKAVAKAAGGAERV